MNIENVFNVETVIKKYLYKNKPTAELAPTDKKDLVLYRANFLGGSVEFEIPFDERPLNGFEQQMPAQLLIRWISKISNFIFSSDDGSLVEK